MKRFISILFAILILSAYPSFAEDDYIAKWDFENFTTVGAVDLSGNGFSGIFDGATKTEGYRGSGAMVTANTQKVSVANLASRLNGSSAITVGGWFNISSLPTSDDYRFFYIQNSVGTVGISGLITKDQKIKIEARTVVGDKGGTLETIVTAEEFSLVNEWHHFTFVVDLKDTPYMGIYIDGVPKIWSNAKKFNDIKTFSFGSAFCLLGFGSKDSFIGSADEVTVYNRRLSDAEILKLSSKKADTNLEKFKIGDTDVLTVENAKVTDFSENGGTILSNIFPIVGIDILFSENSFQQVRELKINGEIASENAEININDVITFEYTGDDWETDVGGKYKITAKGNGTVFMNSGFYDSETKLEFIKDGDITIKTTINSQASIPVSILGVLRKNGKLHEIKMESGVVNSENLDLSTNIVVPKTEDIWQLELHIIDEQFRPLTKMIFLTSK